MERQIHIKAECGAKFIGIDIILQLIVNAHYSPTADQNMDNSSREVIKSLYKERLMNLVKNEQLMTVCSFDLLPYNPFLNGLTSWNDVSNFLVPIDEFTRICKSWDTEVFIEFIPGELQSEEINDGNQKDVLVPQRSTLYQTRDIDAAQWLGENEAKFQLLTMPQIKAALKTRNSKLWSKGFDDWNRNQTVWPKKKVGKKSSV